VSCALSAEFPEALKTGTLDLAIYEVETPAQNEELLAEDPTAWVAATHRDFASFETLPIALFDQACWWREAAIASLEARGKPYRIIYSSQSVSGVLAAVEAGIAVGLLGRSSLHSNLKAIGQSYGLAPTPTSKLVMAEGKSVAHGPLDAMKSAVRAAFLGGPNDTTRRVPA